MPNIFRTGAESWITGSYDPDLNLTYWGNAQSKPWMRCQLGNAIVEQRIDQGVSASPSSGDGKNWPAMSYYQPGNRLIVPLSQSCMEFKAQAVEKAAGGGTGRRGAASLFRDAGSERKRGEARGL